MADYRLRFYRRYPEKRVRQVVIYLRPTTSALAWQTVFSIPGTRHEFEVIRLWEVETPQLLTFPGLLPLAILSRSLDQTATLRQIAQQIDTLPSGTVRTDVAAATAVLAGLVLEKKVIHQILREEIVKESVIYQDILEQGVQRGLQQGLERGLQQGLEREVELVLRLLQRQVGGVELRLQEQVRQLSAEQVEALGEALLDFKAPADLSIWLTEHA